MTRYIFQVFIWRRKISIWPNKLYHISVARKRLCFIDWVVYRPDTALKAKKNLGSPFKTKYENCFLHESKAGTVSHSIT